MAEGTVRWFGGKRPDGKTRGYGFILQDNGEEIFVHYTEIEKEKQGFKTLSEGQRVSFEVGEGQDGKAQAIDVHVIDDAPAKTDAQSAAEAVAAAVVPGAVVEAAPAEDAAAPASADGFGRDDDDDDDDRDDDDDDDEEDDD